MVLAHLQVLGTFQWIYGVIMKGNGVEFQELVMCIDIFADKLP